MRYLLLSLLSINSIFSQPSQTELFPEKKIYKRYYADVLSHQFSILKHFGSNEWFGNIGIEKPLLNISIEDNLYQFTVAATVFNTLKITPPHIQVYTTDYLVDLFIDKELSNEFLVRLNWGHSSAHFSDDGIIQLNRLSINYVRDYIGLGGERLLTSLNGKVYLNLKYNFHNEPRKNKHIHGQFGFDVGKTLATNIMAFIAFDLKIKAEVNYGATKNLQVGIRVFNNNDSSISLAYNYRAGFDERGQLYTESDNKHLLGLYIDF